jgi:hypothetical protein
MRILIVHNHDGIFAVAAEATLLRDHVHIVETYGRTNAEIEETKFTGKIWLIN